MRKIYLKTAISIIATVMMAAVSGYAQEKGDMAVGGNLVFGAGDGFTNFGLGAKFQYSILDPLRLEGTFSYFFKSNSTSMWDMSANAHWLFPVADKMKIYPLGGLSVMGITHTSPVYVLNGISFGGGTTSSTDVGFNIGGGFDCQLTEKITGSAELKCRIGDTVNRFLLSVGIAYKL